MQRRDFISPRASKISSHIVIDMSVACPTVSKEIRLSPNISGIIMRARFPPGNSRFLDE